MVQQPTEVARIKESIPCVDLVFGTHNLHQLPELIAEVESNRSRVFEVWESEGEIMKGYRSNGKILLKPG